MKALPFLGKGKVARRKPRRMGMGAYLPIPTTAQRRSLLRAQLFYKRAFAPSSFFCPTTVGWSDETEPPPSEGVPVRAGGGGAFAPTRRIIVACRPAVRRHGMRLLTLAALLRVVVPLIRPFGTPSPRGGKAKKGAFSHPMLQKFRLGYDFNRVGIGSDTTSVGSKSS